MPRTISAWLEQVASAHAGRPAAQFGDHMVRYGELWSRVEALATAIQRQATFSRGVRIALLGENDPDYLVAYLAILRAGGVAVPLNPRNSSADLAAQLDLVEASWCFVGDGPHADALTSTGLVRRRRDLGEHGSAVEGWPASTDDALVALTSGSTGAPKGVVHTHGSLMHASLSLLNALPFAADEVSVAFLPLYTSAPEHAFPVLMSGGTLRILERFDAQQVLEACAGATSFAAVPTIVSRLLEADGSERLAALRWMSFASEPMPPNVLARWRRELPAVDTYQYYGMTELLPITHAGPGVQVAAPGTVGVGYPTAQIHIVDSELRPVSVGTEGEVVCASPARMNRYLGDADATAAALTADGAMRTGDLGRLDERGRLFLTGRLKDIIISGGLNIAPAEIEAVAGQHPGVSVAAVVGIPDERWGEVPVVVAVPAKDRTLTAAELLGHCCERLAGYKRPAAAAIVPVLPVTGIGKSAKSEIRRAVLSGEVPVVRRAELGRSGPEPEFLTA